MDQFIIEEIDSVPHLEALLLLWNTRPKRWPIEEIARALYISVDATRKMLQDLSHRGLVVIETEGCAYDANYDREIVLQELEKTYRRELVRVSRMIHSKASPAVREFARAFKFLKD